MTRRQIKTRKAAVIMAAVAVSLAVCAQMSWSQEARAEPDSVMVTFLQAFVDYDYATCSSLLAPNATITITRRHQGKAYESRHLGAQQWLDEVGETGVQHLEGFTVDIHESAALLHEHGATVVLRFTATGNAGKSVFTNAGFDTGSLIETPQGWRILHYSSFESFRVERGD